MKREECTRPRNLAFEFVRDEHGMWRWRYAELMGGSLVISRETFSTLCSCLQDANRQQRLQRVRDSESYRHLFGHST